MVSAEISCARCGWRNEATARMCGGCGAPLAHNDSPANEGATVAIAELPGMSDRTPPGFSPGYTPGMGVSDTQPTPPTAVDLRPSAYLASAPATPITPVIRPTTPPVYTPAGDVGQAPAPASKRRGVPWGRVALILVIALVVLGGLAYGGWGLFAQPSIHTSVDTELHTRFATLINAAFKTTSGAHTLTAAQATNALGPADSSEWAQNLQIQFNPGALYLTYTFVGTSGDISTHLYIAQGRLNAAATTVNGYLAGVETGTQAELAINDALALIPSTEVIQQFTVANGQVNFTVA